jgi:uncharacterized membrane protein
VPGAGTPTGNAAPSAGEPAEDRPPAPGAGAGSDAGTGTSAAPAPSAAASAPGTTPPSEAPGPSPSAPGAGTRRSELDALERTLAASWLVWAGGAILALGGLLLVRTAIDAGLFGPLGRTLAATLLGAGLLAGALRAAELPWIGRATGAVPWLPQVLACSGVIVLYGASLAAGALYGLVPPAVAFLAFVGVSLVAVLFALRFGPVPAALGLFGAYAAPALTGAESGALVLLLTYTTAVTAGALTMVRVLQWRYLVWIALAGSGLWGLYAVGVAAPGERFLLLIHPLVLAAVAVLFSHDRAREPLRLGDPQQVRATLQELSESLLATHAFWGLAGSLLLAATLVPQLRDAVPWAVLVLALPALGAAGAREGFALLPAVPVALAVVLLPGRDPAEELPRALLLLAVLTAIAGNALALRHAVRGPLTTIASLTPVLLHGLLFARWQFGGGLPGVAVALLVAAGATALAERERRLDPDLARHPGAVAIHALTALLALALAPFLLLADLWIAPALAAVAHGAARVHRRFPLPLLRLGALAVAALATALYLAPWRLATATVVTTPFLNEFLVVFAAGTALLATAAAYLPAHRSTRDGFAGAATMVAFGGLGVLIRHAATGGDLAAPGLTLAETGGYAVAYLGMAVGIRLRHPDRPWLFHGPVAAANGLGLGAVLAGLLQLGEPVAAFGPLTLLLPALAMPAVLLLVQSRGWRRDVPGLALALALLGRGLLFLWVVLETHRAFTGPDLARPVTGELELWTHSAVGLVFAAALLAVGLLRTSILDRRLSLVVLLLGVAKIFLLDLAGLTGVLRAASFLAMGAVLIAVALVYQRFVFRTGAEDPEPR